MILLTTRQTCGSVDLGYCYMIWLKVNLSQVPAQYYQMAQSQACFPQSVMIISC